ncbi:MAG: J domain-containing protein [Verrucomicrobiaceae bacterium]|nr:J domain-containing protein [Verrucomicrobiaceae bacterium]
MFSDAEETMEGRPSATQFAAPSGKGRKPREKRQRANGAGGQGDDEKRFAEVLRLMPPYSLQQAEQNYRALMKTCHPDPNDESVENNQRAAELNDAIEFFRRDSGS